MKYIIHMGSYINYSINLFQQISTYFTSALGLAGETG